MFLRGNEKNNVYPCKPHFYYIKMGFKGLELNRLVFVMLPHQGDHIARQDHLTHQQAGQIVQKMSRNSHNHIS